MADPLSIASAVVGVVAAGIRLSSALYDICETIGSAQSQVEDIASDLNPLIAVVDELGRTFAVPDVTYSDILLSSLLDVIEQFKKQFKEINRMIGRTVGLPELQLRAKVAWVFREKKVKAVKAGLDSLKSTLNFILTALTVVKGHRQHNKADRDLLGNMLRSQRRSVKVLRNLEKEQADENARHHANPWESEADQRKPRVRTTADVLADVIPLLSRADDRESKPQASASTSSPYVDATVLAPDGYSFDKFDVGSQQPAPSAMTSSFQFKTALGELYPIWKSQVLENVDLLLSRWIQDPIELEGSPSNFTKEKRKSAPSSSSPTDQPSKDHSSTPPSSPIMIDLCKKMEDIKNEKSKKVDGLKMAHNSRNDLEIRLQKIEARLTKREIGWLEIDDKALARLETEMDDIKKRIASWDLEIKSSSFQVEALTRDLLTVHAEFDTRKEAERFREENIYELGPDRNASQIPIIAPGNSSESNVSLKWLTDENDLADSDPEDSNEAINKIPKASVHTPEDMPSSQSSVRSRSPYRKPNNHSLPYPSDPDSETPFPHGSDPITPIPSASHSSQSSGKGRTETSSLPPPSPLVEKSSLRPPSFLLSPQCQRQAWKPPQPFMDGFNTLSYVLRTSMQHRLWFKASQDAYRFYLGAEQNVFYTINLIPSDLATHDTSRIEWTAIEKPWAMAKTLHAMQLPFFEDSVGFMWIRKELNWLEIQQIFETSCSILDTSIHTCAQQIVQKRSVDPRNISSFEKPFISIQQVFNENKSLSQSIHEHHRVFFHADDEELMKRSKRSAKLMRTVS